MQFRRFLLCCGFQSYENSKSTTLTSESELLGSRCSSLVNVSQDVHVDFQRFRFAIFLLLSSRTLSVENRLQDIMLLAVFVKLHLCVNLQFMVGAFYLYLYGSVVAQSLPYDIFNENLQTSDLILDDI